MSHSRRRFLLSAAATLTACRGGGPLTVPGTTSTGDTGALPGGDTGAPGDTGTPGPTEPTIPAGPGPEPSVLWNPPGTLDLATFACGVQTGDATPTAVLVSVRQWDEPVLRLVLARGEADGWVEIAEQTDLEPDDGVLQLELTDLWPDHTYAVVFYAADGVRRSNPARFRTALAAGTSRVVTIGATSCLGSPNAPWPNLSKAALEKLDAFLLLGDTIYADEGLLPAGNWDEHWTDALSTQGLRDVTMSTSVVATWDDHEVDNNWTWEADGDEALEALRAFRRGLPMRQGAEGSGIWRKLSWGDAVDLFVLDCRGERVAGRYLSEAQQTWLQDGLTASTARFKLILNSVPITDLGLASSDGWMGFRDHRDEILSYVRDSGVGGVLWVAGDVHWATLCSVDRPGDPFDDQLEVFAGPSGSTINPVAFVVPVGGQHEVVIKQHNWLRLTCDPDAGTIRLAWVGDDGAEIASREVALP